MVPVYDIAGQRIHDQFLMAMRLKGGGPAGWFATTLRCRRAGDFAGTFRHLARMGSTDGVSEPSFWSVMIAIADLLDADARAQLADEIALCVEQRRSGNGDAI